MRTHSSVAPAHRILLNTLACCTAVAALALAPKALGANCNTNPSNQNFPPDAKVSPTNGQTVAEATVVGGVRTPTAVTLNGNSSRGNTFLWTQTGGPSVFLVDANTDKATFTAPEVGAVGATLTFNLAASCNGLTDNESTNVNITNVNRAPVAIAGADDLVLEDDVVTLTGTGTDGDADSLTYSWAQIAGPAVTLSGTGATRTFTAPVPPTPAGVSLTFRLTVSDGSLTGTDDKIVNVLWVNDPPDAVASCSPSPVNEGALVTLDGSGSTDPDDGIASYLWEQLNGPPDSGIGANPNSVVTFNAPQLHFGNVNTLDFRLTATDNGGLPSTEKCSITIRDVTPPAVNVPGPISKEATGVSGAQVTYTVTADDLFDGPVTASCTPSSGSTFALGNTTVDCEAFDAAGNRGTGSFTVSVVDTTPPDFTAPANITVEATSAGGATVSYTSPSTFDLVSGPGTASCLPASGGVFPLGTMTVTCSASDAVPNTSTKQFTIGVVDTTAPTIAAHDDITVEATSASGAVVSYIAPATSDIVDGTGTASCTSTPASGGTFPIGTTTVTCNATDAHGNAAIATTFKVIVKDSTPPVIAPHGDITAEATSAAGAVVTYTAPATSDIVDGAGTATCTSTPASGGTFPLGSTTVTCNATDAHGNAATAATFKVIVKDTTPPVIAAHADVVVEATSAAGAVASYSPSTTSDLVDGAGVANCSSAPPSGGTFPIGSTTVTCSATDAAGNPATSTTFKVTVQDTTAPVIAAHADVTAEATGPGGAAVTYTSPPTSDAVDGAGVATCAPASGSIFLLGSTPVTCNKTDAHGNAATPTTFRVIVRDTTAPVIAAHADVVVEATSGAGAVATYTPPLSSDAVDGSKPAVCTSSPASGGTFPLGSTTVTCNATDAAGNVAAATTFKVKVVDTTAPVIAPHADVTVDATSGAGAIATYTAPSTSDLVDGAGTATCSPASGTNFAVGSTTVTCTAKDAAGNSAVATTFKVNVVYKWTGFFSPINNAAMNSVKAGQAIPVKFSLGGNMGMGIFEASYPRVVSASCASGYVDEILDTETVNAGGSSLNYDAASNQYVYVWKTEKSWAGICVQLQVKLNDGSMHTASFEFKK